ncbi:hypothetical protein [Candidatus Palauibacter sp.]|uniref:hypothetical protein n=1 Tax=Candidatus Palauibacter sp. TaxID=3101350 RepID=UPI003AF2A891
MIELQPVTLEGRSVRLEPLGPEHADALAEAAADGELWNLFFTFVPAPDEVTDYIETALEGQAAGHMLPWRTRVEPATA